MKILLELSQENKDTIIVEALADILKDSLGDGFNHPDDVKYNKKLQKAASILLDYYGY